MIESIQPYLEPLHKSITVSQTPEEAFRLFTSGIASWWPSGTYSVSLERVKDVILEPEAGGSIYEVRDDGKTFPWGKVLVWEPPKRFVMSWYPGRQPDTAQEVEIQFIADASGTRIELEHRNWQTLGDAAAAMREGYNSGWDVVLGEFLTRSL
jgi:uncharacterized protein YndB with AHSA1/START domain